MPYRHAIASPPLATGTFTGQDQAAWSVTGNANYISLGGEFPKVNGIALSHQVVHHLDLIEAGRHKIHFFDDSLMAGSVASLESTVLTDYERTMLAAHATSPASRASSTCSRIWV